MFEASLLDYGLDRCSIKGRSLIIGVGPDEPLGERLENVPQTPDGVLFLNAPEQVELIEKFLQSDHAGRVQHLALGTSHLVAEQRGSLDFTRALSALSGKSLPALKSLSLGNMERLFNGHSYYGSLGDIAAIFASAPNLQSMELFGHFSLSKIVNHDQLWEFSVITDDIGVTGGPPSQSTLDNLLSSHFPMISNLELWLDEGSDDLSFTLPEKFFTGYNMPMLEHFGIDRLAAGSLSRLQLFAGKRGITLHLE